MAIKTAEYYGLDQTLIQMADSSTFQQAAKRPMRTGFILDKAYRELGYQPRSFDQGIALMAEQVKNLS
jgi:dTDP-4-dehydrorhamnose reductase